MVVVKSAKKGEKSPLVLEDPAKSVPFMRVVSEPKVDEESEEDFELDEEEDLLFNMLVEDSGSPKIVDYLLQELASEIHALKGERTKKANKEMSTTQISARRIDALKKAGDLWFKRKEIGKSGNIDIKSSEFQDILKSLLTKVKETMNDSGFNREMVQVFFTKLSQNFTSWEEELIKIQITRNDDDDS